MKPVLTIKLGRRANKDGLFVIYLRVRSSALKFDREYDTGQACTRDEFETVMGQPRTERLRGIRAEVNKVQTRAQDIIDNTANISPEVFEVLFNGSSGNGLDSMVSLFNLKIKELKAQEEQQQEPNSHPLYNATRNALVNYLTAKSKDKRSPVTDISLTMINKAWLKAYETHEVNRGIAYNTIGIHTRNLRAIFNMAIHEIKCLSPAYYPFGQGGYTTPTEEITNHNFLEEEHKNKLITYEAPTASINREIEHVKVLLSTHGFSNRETRAKHRALLNKRDEIEEKNFAVAIWKLLYFSNGINCLDACRLRYRDIVNDVITIERTKSKKGKRIRKKMSIPVHPEAKAIINKYGTRSLNPDEFVLPILRAGMSPRQIKDKVHKFVKRINRVLKEVSADLKLPFEVKTYTARHTFSHIVIQSGASTEQLQDALGHSTSITTERYKHGFGIGAKRALSEKLGAG